jgi:beta-lactamase class A
MRILSLAFVCLTPVLAQQPAPLQTQVEAIAAQHHGKVALFAENLQTHKIVAISPDAPVQTASTIKLAILYEALEQIRAGRTHMDTRLTLTAADQVPGSGVLQHFDTPLPLTLKDALTLMIVMSDNTATNLAIDHLGLGNINGSLAKLGLKNTYLYKKVFTPVTPGTVMPADQKRFGLGKTTAREMALLMTKIATCDLGGTTTEGDEKLCAAALHMLHAQFYRDGIPRYLDGLPGAAGDSIASKSGALDASRSDVAMISTKAGMVVVSIYTYENADQSWTPDDEGDLTVAKLARAIVAAWSPLGLAAWPAALPERN